MKLKLINNGCAILGGLLRYGIPNLKMEKRLIDRRMAQMSAEGVEFLPNSHVGGNVPVEDLRRDFTLFCSRAARDTHALWPMQFRVESSHEEGGIRKWKRCVATVRFTGDERGNVGQLHGTRVGAPPSFEPIPDSEFTLEADLVLLAMGFTGSVKSGLIERPGVKLDESWHLRGGRYAGTIAGGVGGRGGE